jgi:tetratricopeptide (TPR) repeat protein
MTETRSTSRLPVMAVASVAVLAVGGAWFATRPHRAPNVLPGVRSNTAATMHYEAGRELARSGKRAGAVREWTTAIGLDPGFPAPYFAIAAEDQSGGSYSSAVKRLESLRLANPSADHIDCREADLYFRAGRTDSALQIARAAVRREPKCALAHSALGAALESHGDYPASVSEIQLAHALDPASEGITLNLAQTLAKAGRSAEAIRLTGDLLRFQPKHPAQAYLVMGRLQAQFGKDGKPDYKTARNFFEKILEQDQNSTAAAAEFGAVMLRLGHLPEARAALELAAARGASDTAMVAALAETYNRLHDPRGKSLSEQAQGLAAIDAELLRARQQRYREPDSADTALQLARADQRAANIPDAIDLVTFALQKDPNREEALTLMSELTSRTRYRPINTVAR